MANGEVKLDEIGPWSREKLQMLAKYLAAYVNILSTDRGKKHCSDFHYIDAFAGATEHIEKETGEYLDGSPRVALKTSPKFSSYTFIEKNRKRYQAVLEPLKNEYPDLSITPLHGDCNKLIKEKVLPLFPRRKWNQPNKLGFAFLDPYGTNLLWDTVKALGEAGTFDVLINMSVMGVTRQSPGAPPPKEVQDNISRFMGGDDWFNECYQDNDQYGLPGISVSPVLRRQENVAERIAECYQKKMTTCFKYVSPYRMMRGPKNSPYYALIFASQAKTAVDKMQGILHKLAGK